MNKIFASLLLLLLTMNAFGQKQGGDTGLQPLQPTQSVYEKVSLQLPSNAGAAEVRLALLGMKPLVAALGCDLALRERIESPGGCHYHFDQTWQGVPIYMARIQATLTKTQRFMNVLNTLQSFTGTPAMHQRSDAQVAALLPALLDEGHADFHVVENQRQFFWVEGALLPCHRVVYTANTMSWELLLADDDLRALLRRDLAAYRKPVGTTVDTTGQAMVFMPDPLTRVGLAYGGTLVDNNDADHADLNAQRVAVSLRDITWDGVKFVLTGPYVDIKDLESPTSTPVTSTDGDFNFTRSQQGFEDANVYYHLDTMQRYIQSLGYTNLRNGPLKADPHGVNSQDNSHFVPAGIDTRLGFGEGGVDDAEDADVIIHEYGHALSDAGCPGCNAGNERQGLDEGIGDYFAASYSRGISYTFWKNTFTWDGHNEFWPGRSASNPTMYPPGTSNIYVYGEIWASVLMELYPQIGKTNSDKVVLQSLYNNGASILLSDAALIIFDADTLLFNGAHHDAYQQAFCARGILSGTMMGQGCYVATDDAHDALALDWAIFPNPASAAATLAVKGNLNSRDLQYRLIDLMGRTLRNGNIKGQQAEIDLTGLAPALYLVQLRASNGWSETRRLVVE
jgi:zinc metalloprotease ZmpB